MLFAGGLVAGALGVGVAAAQPARPVPVVPAASHLAALTAAAQAEMVAQDLRGLPQRPRQGRRPLPAGMDARGRGVGRDKAEKMIRKLRAGMMPPAGARRPDEAQLARLASALETRMDAIAARVPRSRAGGPSSG